MILHDVNVLVYSYIAAGSGHEDFRDALESVVHSKKSFGYSNLVLSGFLRVVTNPKIFDVPAPLADATDFVEALRGQPNAVEIRPGQRHWGIFIDLCHAAGAKGNLIPDAFFAALAIESGSTWLTTDRDYARFDNLEWRHPLD